MDIDASLLVWARTEAMQQAAMMKIVRKTHEMQMQLIDRLSEVARAVPPPGQGRLVDRLA
jgi:hypothetical protein